MERSEDIAELAKALCNAQKTDLFALTDKDNPFFKSKYADLSSVWNAARKPLTDNGLSVVQTTAEDTDGVIVETMLMHTSGQFITGKLKMVPEKKTPQGFGSAMTYARRYALAAIVGICPDDDDGEGAMKDREKKNAEPKKEKRTSAPAKTLQSLRHRYGIFGSLK